MDKSLERANQNFKGQNVTKLRPSPYLLERQYFLGGGAKRLTWRHYSLPTSIRLKFGTVIYLILVSCFPDHKLTEEICYNFSQCNLLQDFFIARVTVEEPRKNRKKMKKERKMKVIKFSGNYLPIKGQEKKKGCMNEGKEGIKKKKAKE